ncbi:MAG: hypothetical protein HQL09_03550 [Nitrospirae bacterium]|nr:hypothetical protein [Nitrospirota bacterium]
MLIIQHGRDWRRAGIIIPGLRKKYGFEARYLSHIQNDILIACSARKIGVFVAIVSLSLPPD